MFFSEFCLNSKLFMHICLILIHFLLSEVAKSKSDLLPSESSSSFTVVGKQRAGESVRAPSNTKLVDIKAPDLSLNLGDNQYSRSITLSTSQNVANARIDASEPNFKNKDRSAVVRAVVSVSDSNGNLVRKGTVTDITNE